MGSKLKENNSTEGSVTVQNLVYKEKARSLPNTTRVERSNLSAVVEKSPSTAATSVCSSWNNSGCESEPYNRSYTFDDGNQDQTNTNLTEPDNRSADSYRESGGVSVTLVAKQQLEEDNLLLHALNSLDFSSNSRTLDKCESTARKDFLIDTQESDSIAIDQVDALLSFTGDITQDTVGDGNNHIVNNNGESGNTQYNRKGNTDIREMELKLLALEDAVEKGTQQMQMIKGDLVHQKKQTNTLHKVICRAVEDSQILQKTVMDFTGENKQLLGAMEGLGIELKKQQQKFTILTKETAASTLKSENVEDKISEINRQVENLSQEVQQIHGQINGAHNISSLNNHTSKHNTKNSNEMNDSSALLLNSNNNLNKHISDHGIRMGSSEFNVKSTVKNFDSQNAVFCTLHEIDCRMKVVCLKLRNIRSTIIHDIIQENRRKQVNVEEMQLIENCSKLLFEFHANLYSIINVSSVQLQYLLCNATIKSDTDGLIMQKQQSMNVFEKLKVLLNAAKEMDDTLCSIPKSHQNMFSK